MLRSCTVACPPGNPDGYKGAYKVSYNRPLNTAEDDGGRSALFTGAEYTMVRWLERNGYDVSYTNDVSVDKEPSRLLHHRAIVIGGHAEYWTKAAYDGAETARAKGLPARMVLALARRRPRPARG